MDIKQIHGATYSLLSPGLTKRELFAAMAMQAIAGKAGTPANEATYQHWTQIACKWADALLEALSQD